MAVLEPVEYRIYGNIRVLKEDTGHAIYPQSVRILILAQHVRDT